MLLFGKYTQRWMPMMTAKCICFAGNSVGSKIFRDKVNDADMEGNLLHQYDTIMDFFTRNLHNVQVEDEFNSMGKLEIPYTSLVEFTVNSLVHRSLNMKAPVRIFIFMLINALILGITRLHMKWANRRYEWSRWLILAGMTGLAIQYLLQMLLGFRAKSDDLGAIFNILVYTPCIITIAMGILGRWYPCRILFLQKK